MPNGLMNLMPRPGNWRDWRQALDVISDPFIPGNWWDSQRGRMNNPLQAFGMGGLMNMFNRPGAPLPGWMNPNGPGANPGYQGPGSPGWQPNIPGTEQDPHRGEGPQRDYQRDRNPGSRVGMPSAPGQRGGAAGSRTVAEGRDAQDMVDRMRDGANRAQLDAQAREARRRMERLER